MQNYLVKSSYLSNKQSLPQENKNTHTHTFFAFFETKKNFSLLLVVTKQAFYK
jgi:hypothetical protein